MPILYSDTILRPNHHTEFSGNDAPQLRQSIKSFPYFFNRLNHLSMNGLSPAPLNEKQKGWYSQIQENQIPILRKTRQEGMTTMLSSLVLWKALFHMDSRIVVVADRDMTARRFLEQVKKIYEGCPTHLKRGVEEYNSRRIVFDNQSFIQVSPLTRDAVRGMALSWIVFEQPEYAIGDFDELYTSCMPSLATNPYSKMIVPWEFSRPLPECLRVGNRRNMLEQI
jgi:hypothetical protein